MTRCALAVCALLVACTDTAAGVHIDPGRDAAPIADFAEAGVCSGLRTLCDVPEFSVLSPGPDAQLECSLGDPLPLSWTAELGSFDGPLPDCPAVDPVVAEGPGARWAVALLRQPSRNPLGNEAVGFVLEQFDDTGKRLLALPSDVRRPVDGVLDDGTTRVLHSGIGGELFWATASTDGSTLELRRYSNAGKLESSRRPVRGAAPTYGDVRWLTDGSSLVTYRYTTPRVDGGRQVLIPGVARFDAAGRLSWNQTFFSNMIAANAGIAALSIAIAGTDDAGDAVIQATVSHADGTTDADIVKLDADGNPAWARQIEGAAFLTNGSLRASVGFDAEGTIRALYSLQSPFATVFEEIAPDGTSRGRTLFDAVSEAAVDFDANGRAWLTFRNEPSSFVRVVSRAESTCVSRRLTEAGCVLDADGNNEGCGEPVISLSDSGDVFFGVTNVVGVARWQ